MKLTPCLRGEPIQMPAAGSIGFVRRRAPVDGFAVDLGETCGFVPAKDIETALMNLKLRVRSGRRRR